MGLSAPRPDDRRSIRVLHVITSLDVGGAERMLVSLATAARADLDQQVVSLIPGGHFAPTLRAAGIPVIELPLGPWPPRPWVILRLVRLIRLVAADVVQSWLYHADLAAAVALALSGRRRRTRLVWGLQTSKLATRQYHAQLRVVIRLCAAVSRYPDVVLSNSHAGLVSHRALGYRPALARVIFPGVDAELFKPDPGASVRVRAALGIAPAAPLVAHVARRDPMKDHGCLLGALGRLPGVHVLAIGRGTEALPAMPTLHRLGQRGDVERLLPACDVSVSSSAFGEGFSNALAESMATGVPVVATDVGDARVVVGDTGEIVPPAAPALLAEGIRRLLAEPAAPRVARRERARARVVTHFGRAAMVGAYLALYRELVDRAPGSH